MSIIYQNYFFVIEKWAYFVDRVDRYFVIGFFLEMSGHGVHSRKL